MCGRAIVRAVDTLRIPFQYRFECEISAIKESMLSFSTKADLSMQRRRTLHTHIHTHTHKFAYVPEAGAGGHTILLFSWYDFAC